MEEAVQSRLFLSLAFVLAAGCATDARELPADMSRLSPLQRVEAKPFGQRDLARSCAELLDERVKVEAAIAEIDASLAARRNDEQVVGYVAATVFFPAALLATRDDLRERVTDLRERRDWLTLVLGAKECRA